MPQNTGGITDFVNSVELVEWVLRENRRQKNTKRKTDKAGLCCPNTGGITNSVNSVELVEQVLQEINSLAALPDNNPNR